MWMPVVRKFATWTEICQSYTLGDLCDLHDAVAEFDRIQSMPPEGD
jgi:hypothetical protein